MRNAFVNALIENATKDTILITGDLGFGVLSEFHNKFPKQYLNAGVAEQNMTSVAAGLSIEGKKVFTYSIANFNTLRALEQIRNDVAYHNLNVAIVAVGGGLCYGQLGISHHATEDLAILRAIPNMTVFAPGDTKEAYIITKLIIEQELGPVYLRIGRAGEATIHSDDSIKNFKVGKFLPLIVEEKANIAILSTGGMLETAKAVHDVLFHENLTASVYSFHTIKPFDKEGVLEIFNKYSYIYSIEEHSIIGGFASAISESLIGIKNCNIGKFYAFALPSEFTSKVGDQNYLRNIYGLSVNNIVSKIKQFVENE